MKTIDSIAKNCPLTYENLVEIEELILLADDYSSNAIRREMDWFCNELGIDRYYFETTPLDLIAQHIESLHAAEIISRNSGAEVDLQLASENPKQAVYLVAAIPEAIDEVEKRIENKYPSFRLQSYRTKGRASGRHLRLYFVTAPEFLLKEPGEKWAFEKAANKTFLKSSPASTMARYKSSWSAAQGKESPVIDITEKPETNETRIMVTLKQDSSKRFLYEFSHVLDTYDIHTNRKYVEPFADDKVTFSFYFDKIQDSTILKSLEKDLSAVVIMPPSDISELFRRRQFSGQETLYAIAIGHFAHQFLTSDSEEFYTIAKALEGQNELKGILANLKTKLVKDTYTLSKVEATIVKYPAIVKLLFEQFKGRFFERVAGEVDENLGRQILKQTNESVPSDIERHIIHFFQLFNQVVLKTNFFKQDKACLSFRLDPSFLEPVEYPAAPFGLFYLLGKEFKGYHVRFKDIARGGIRIVGSRTREIYDINSDFIFDENYNLASTQQMKNKDIPEGGAKGTILLYPDFQGNAITAFRNYVDGLLDLLLPSEEVLDRYGEKEILFLGPDEGTAELMDWACQRARDRGYPYWKSITTGKKPSLGGVPHDLYGMTTCGVHEYVLGVLEELNLEESNITKIQTGGPDGDLGSNEIKISKDKTIAVVDGSGVLYDPAGIDREELLGLAESRKPVVHFSRAKLSAAGYFISVDAKDVQLPDGRKISNGEDFRNRFHLLPEYEADLFVPCGGRPKSIHIGNWKQILNKEGKPRFKAIVEGANLFITQDARILLEGAGILLIKDASANKGGVISSSLEVLASLALDDGEYTDCMMVKGNTIPPFREKYVQEILERIKKNARMEFALLKKENRKNGIPRATLSDQISGRINFLADSISQSSIRLDPDVTRSAIEGFCPKILLNRVKAQTIISRLPGNYLNSITACYLASNFIYSYGIHASEVDFYSFIERLKNAPTPAEL